MARLTDEKLARIEAAATTTEFDGPSGASIQVSDVQDSECNGLPSFGVVCVFHDEYIIE